MKAFIVIPVEKSDEKSEAIRATVVASYGVSDDSVVLVDNECAKGMAGKYNYAINKVVRDELFADDVWLIFQHEDVDMTLRPDVLESRLLEVEGKGAKIIGVAGNLDIPPVNPGLWWYGLGSPQFKGAGVVEHPLPDKKNEKGEVVEAETRSIPTVYGPYPQEVQALDGLWLAARVGTFRSNGQLRFDDVTFDNYHYYDVDFCATSRQLGQKLFVINAGIWHKSRGEKAVEAIFAFEQGKFIKKWFSRMLQYNRKA